MYLLTQFLFAALLVFFSSDTYALKEVETPNESSSTFDRTILTNELPTLSVKGNRFVDNAGNTFIFKGMSIADPDKLLAEGRWNKRLFEELSTWGVNTVRLPVHPRAWRKQGVANYLALLDQAIIWANEHNMYVIVDWHSIGDLAKGTFQRDIYETTLDETLNFWKIISHRYQGLSTVALYELFNEPTTLSDKVKANWSQWKAFNEFLIDTIKEQDDKTIFLVAGFNWAYDLTPVRMHPIDRPNVGYVSHPYPQKAGPGKLTKQDQFTHWDKHWGYVAKDYPIVTTEIGWVKADGFGAHNPVKNDGEYGPHIVEYLNKSGISWIGWVFDPRWSPVMIKNWDFEPSQQGAFFKNELLKSQ
jgi:aryl-phospho-beta-D-glucosidase BglC (GH1 family)